MAPLSFTKAKEAGAINEKEIERFAMLYMYMIDEIKPDAKAMEMCAVQAGNTTGSFKEAIRVTVKKLREKDCVVGDEEHAAPTTAAPKATPGKKRKAAAATAEDGEEKPAKKKGGRAAKKAEEVKEKQQDDGDEKEEEEEEEEKKDSAAAETEI